MPLNVAMTLSLIDSASPQVRAFIGLLERLEVVAKSVSQSMAGIGSIGGGGGGRGGITEANVQAWGRMVSMAEQMNGRIDQMKGKIQGAAQAMDQSMAQAMGRAQSAAERLDSVIGSRSERSVRGTANQQMSAALENERRASLAAGGAGRAAWTATSTAELAALERGLRSARIPADELNQSFVGIGDTIKGLAAIWAAFKIEKFLKDSVNAAADFQTEMAKLRSTGVGPDIASREEAAAFRDSSRLPFASPLDALRMRQAMMAGSAERGETPMSQSILDQITPALLATTNALRMMGDKADVTQIGRNLVGLFEERGITTNAARMQSTLDLIANTYSVTQGKVTPTDFDVFARRFGAGMSQISDEGLRNMAAFINQMKVMGGEAGGGVGGGASSLATAMKQLEAMALGKPIVGQARSMWIETGAFEGTPGRKGLTAREPDLITKDPIGFFIKYAPNIIEYTKRYMKEFYGGKDPSDPENQAAAMQKFLAMTGITVTTQQAAMLAINPATSERMQKQSAQIGAAPGVKGINDIFAETYRQQIVNFDAAISKLQMTLGNAFLPTIVEVVKAVTSFVQSIAEFNRQQPEAAKIEVIGLVVLGLGAAFIAVQKLLGPFGIALGAVFGGMGTAATAGGAAAEAATVGLFARLGGIIKGGLGVITAAFIGWYLGKLFLGTDYGKRTEETASRIFDLWGRGGITQANVAAVKAAASGDTSNARNYVSGGELANFRRMERASAQADEEADRARRRTRGPVSPLGDPTAAKAKGSGGVFNEDAAYAQADYRVADEERRQSLAALDRLYKDGKLSVNAYYDAVIQKNKDAAVQERQAKQDEIDAIYNQKKITPANDRRLVTLRTDLELIDLKEKGAIENANLERERAKAGLERQAIDVEREGMMLSGRRHDAEMLHLREQLEIKARLAVLNGTMTQADADAYKARAIASLQVSQGMENLRLDQERAANKNLEIDNQVRSMAITEEDAARQKHANAMRLAADQLAEIDRNIILAQQAHDDQRVVQLQALRIQAQGVLTQLGPDAKAAADVMGNAFTGLFSSLLTGTKGIKAAFHDFFASLAQGFANLAAKELSNNVIKMLFGKGGSEGGGGGGFSLGSLFGGGGLNFGSLFGGGGGAAIGGDYVGLTASPSIGDFFGVGLAGGIDYVPKDMVTLIHEGERVVPKAQNTGMMGGMTQHNYFNSPVDTRSRAQVASATLRGIEMSRRVR